MAGPSAGELRLLRLDLAGLRFERGELRDEAILELQAQRPDERLSGPAATVGPIRAGERQLELGY